MKKILLLLIFVLLIVNIVYADVNLSNGLTVCMGFDGNLYDSIGLHNGTSSGTPVYVSGVAGQAISFTNTANQQVNLADANNEFDCPTGNCTFVWWANKRSGEAEMQRGPLVQYTNFALNYWGGIFSSSNGGNWNLYNDLRLSPVSYPNVSSNWSMYAVVIDETNISTYFNGTLVTSTAKTAWDDEAPGTPWILGSQFNNPDVTDADIDEFKIYNRALNQLELDSLYNNAVNTSCSQLTSTSTVDLNNGLIKVFNFENSLADGLNGYSPSSIIGDISFVPGIDGNAAYFDGSSCAVYPTDSSLILGTGNFSFSVWVNYTDYNGAPRVFNIQDVDGPYHSASYAGTAWGGGIKSNVIVEAGDHVSGSITYNNGELVHWVVVRDGSQLKMYKDSVLYSQQAISPGYLINDVYKFYIGCRTPTLDIPSEFMYGSFDAFYFYNRPLNDAEVTALQTTFIPDLPPSPTCSPGNLTCGLVSEWKFNEASGSNVANSVNPAYDGTAYGTTIVNGWDGRARNFNGISYFVGDYVDTNLRVNLSNGWTFTSRAKVGTINNARSIIGANVAGGCDIGDPCFYIFVDENGNVGADIRDGQLNQVGAIYNCSSLNHNDYHFIALTFGNDATELYVNGQFCGYRQNTNFNESKYEQTAMLIDIGRDGASNGGHWNGSLDQIKVYNRKLSNSDLALAYAEAPTPLNEPVVENITTGGGSVPTQAVITPINGTIDYNNVTTLIVTAPTVAITVDFTGESINYITLNTTAIIITDKSVSIDTTLEPQLNIPATLIFNNIGPGATVLRNGQPCGNYCNNIRQVGRTLTFDVSGFSTYSVSEEAKAGCENTRIVVFAAFGLIAIILIVSAAFLLMKFDMGFGAYLVLAISSIGLAIVLFVGYYIISAVQTAICI